MLWGFSRAHLCACSILENNAFGLRVSAVASHLTIERLDTMSTTTNIQKVEAVRQPINALTALTRQLGLVDQEEVYGIMMKTVMPSGSSNEEVAAFCMTAAAYGLNPFIKEIHAFRGKNGGIQPMVGIDGWLKLVHANADFDGMEHEYAEDGSWVECRIFSKSKSRPTVVREYMAENRVESSPVWKQRPLRMLRHRATIQAIRYFMGVGGLADREEFIEYEMQQMPMRDAKPSAKKADAPAFLETKKAAPADVQQVATEGVLEFGDLV